MFRLDRLSQIEGWLGHSSHAWAWLVIAVAVVLALIFIPKLQTRQLRVPSADNRARFDAENEARKTLAQILGGLFVLVGLYSSFSTLDLSTQNLSLSRDGQITERFTKAVEELAASDEKGEPKMEVRIGGIYALERIARDSERDRQVIMEVLCTYVREHSPAEKNKATTPSSLADLPRTGADIRAVLTVLGRRRFGGEVNLANVFLPGASLLCANLRGANLTGAHLEYATLSDADLSSANLSGGYLRDAHLYHALLESAILHRAHLMNADLRGGHFHDARFLSADLSDADLAGADLKSADFSTAYLKGANLASADLTGANFSGADLRGARNLTQQQIDSARADGSTKWPSLKVDPEARTKFWADPDPLTGDANRYGITTLKWTNAPTEKVDICILDTDSTPTKCVCPEKSSTGTCTTGLWVRDGMVFYLREATVPKFCRGAMLATAKVRVQ